MVKYKLLTNFDNGRIDHQMILNGIWKNTISGKIIRFANVRGNEISLEFEDGEFMQYEKYRIVYANLKKIKISSCARSKKSVVYIISDDYIRFEDSEYERTVETLTDPVNFYDKYPAFSRMMNKLYGY